MEPTREMLSSHWVVMTWLNVTATVEAMGQDDDVDVAELVTEDGWVEEEVEVMSLAP